jgi:hypothetical protein
MTDETTDPCQQLALAEDAPASTDAVNAETHARAASQLTRRSLVRTGAIALVGSLAGYAASKSTVDTPTNETASTPNDIGSPTNGTGTRWSGRGAPKKAGVSLWNSTDDAHEVSVVVTKSDQTDFKALPKEFTPTGEEETRSPVFQRDVALSPDARQFYEEVFREPEERVAYRAIVTLDDGRSTGYVFDDTPKSGFIALSIEIWQDTDILVSQEFV